VETVDNECNIEIVYANSMYVLEGGKISPFCIQRPGWVMSGMSSDQGESCPSWIEIEYFTIKPGLAVIFLPSVVSEGGSGWENLTWFCNYITAPSLLRLRELPMVVSLMGSDEAWNLFIFPDQTFRKVEVEIRNCNDREMRDSP
jgi:hypothetical protein